MIQDAPAHPPQASCLSWTSHVDLLFFRAHENGLDYVIADGHRIRHPKPEADLGFRIGFGTTLPHDAWHLTLTWTHLHTDSRAHLEKKVLQPLWMTIEMPQNAFVENARANWRLHLGLVDLMIAKEKGFGPFLKLSPFFGLRAAFVRQKYRIEYAGGTLLPDAEDALSMKNKNQGLGLIAGLETLWRLHSGFSLKAKTAFSLIYGSFYVHQDEDAAVEIKERLKFHNIFLLSSAICEIGLGIEWRYFFHKSSAQLRAYAGIERAIFFAQNQFSHFLNPSFPGIQASNQGDLTLEGYAIGLNLFF
ncbi:MAG: Lpg1974 family pore-forming outer membrane protein [Anaerolineae bacterium]